MKTYQITIKGNDGYTYVYDHQINSMLKAIDYALNREIPSLQKLTIEKLRIVSIVEVES